MVPGRVGGIDLRLVLDAGSRLAAGQPMYADSRFLYPPLAAVIGRPLSAFGFDALSVTLAALKFALAGACVFSLVPGFPRRYRILAFVGVSCSLPFLHDVMLGNVNVFIVAAMVPAILARPRARHGILLGLVAAAFAKPLLLPVFVWLLIWRPRVVASAVVSAMAATALAVALVGPGAYADWMTALRGGERFAGAFAGNHGVTALVPELWLPVATVASIGFALVLLKRGPIVGLIWAVTVGLLIAPYAGTYAALPIAVALPPLGRVVPRLSLAIVAVSPLAVTHPLPIYAAAILVASLWASDLEPARLRALRWPWRWTDSHAVAARPAAAVVPTPTVRATEVG